MTRKKQFSTGAKTYADAFGFIFKNKLAWTFLIPIALTIVFVMSGTVFVGQFFDYINNLITSKVGIDETSFWGGMLSGLVNFVMYILSFIILAYISGYIVIILMSPLLSYLSEKTEKILTGEEYTSDFSQIAKDVVRGVLLSLRNLFLELILLFLMFLLSFIPVVGLVATVFVFLISAYFYGFSFIDFSNERHQLNVKQSVKLVKKHKWLAIGNGTVFSLFLFVPFFSVFLSMFGSIIAVVAATIALHKAEVYQNLPVKNAN